MDFFFFPHSVCCSSWLLITVHFTQIVPEFASSSLFMCPFDIFLLFVVEERSPFLFYLSLLRSSRHVVFSTLVLESAISFRSPIYWWWETSQNTGSWWICHYWDFLASRPLVNRAGNMCIWIYFGHVNIPFIWAI